MTGLLLAALLSVSDAPVRPVLLPDVGGSLAAAAQAPGEVPNALVEARKLLEDARYEEAVVEYQKYLALADRPANERALALLELGFLHLVLDDETNATTRAQQALELDPKLSLPADAPAKQVGFLAKARKAFLARARLEVEDRQDDDPPSFVRVKVIDPEARVKKVLVRHALASTGPFHSTELECEGDRCKGAIPPPLDASSFTAWYYLEALDAQRSTVARSPGPDAPLQLAVVGRKSWYASPVVWGVAGAALMAVAGVVYLLSPAPTR